MRPIGLIANPASGKDVRRLVARASVFDNQEKQAIVRRLLIGALAAGATEFRYLNDQHGILRGALDELRRKLNAKPVDATATGTALDTISAARALEDADCGVVITLGGDGTNRAVTFGWPQVPLIPISTGTNNVFPVLTEATVAGTAAGLLATEQLSTRRVFTASKLIELEIEDERPDLALIDAVLSAEQFVGARALLEPKALREILLTRADPAAVGMTSIGGLLRPVSVADDHGLRLKLNQSDAPSHIIHAPIAPGLFHDVQVDQLRRQPLEQWLSWRGPGVLAFDGERERLLGDG
ncbi:MAG: NAD(+)/NADH kinase, partial [Pseudomonadota bacterium]